MNAQRNVNELAIFKRVITTFLYSWHSIVGTIEVIGVFGGEVGGERQVRGTTAFNMKQTQSRPEDMDSKLQLKQALECYG
jgi:hypothetical protein